MTLAGSYAPHATVAGGLPAELARLRQQARLTWEREWQVLSTLGVPEGGRVLDLGCGPGTVRDLLAAALPGRRVVGVDVDLELLGHARAGSWPQGLVAGRGAALPFADGSLDGVLARYVAQHLADPLPVLREAARVLAPGGWLACVDVDEQLWGVAEPADPGLADVYRRAAGAQAGRGGDRAVVRRLPGLLSRAGLVDVQVRPFAVSSLERPIEELAVHLGPERLLPALAAGLIDLGDYMRVAMAAQRLLDDPAAYVLLLGFVVVGRAPLPRTPLTRTPPVPEDLS